MCIPNHVVYDPLFAHPRRCGITHRPAPVSQIASEPAETGQAAKTPRRRNDRPSWTLHTSGYQSFTIAMASHSTLPSVVTLMVTLPLPAGGCFSPVPLSSGVSRHGAVSVAPG